MSKIKTAVIGVGKLGQHHARWLNSLEKSELVGVYDADNKRAEEIASLNGAKAFASLEEAISSADAFSIAATTTSHFEIASRIIESKKHCLIEKPVTSTVEEAQELKKLAEKNGVIVTVGHIERFNPAVQALKDYDINPRFIEAHRLAAFDPRGTDVAVILDLMIHDIELAVHFIKSPVKHIEASAIAVISDHADIANARISFENGAVANLTASRISLKPMRKLRIFQKSGYFSLDLATKKADVYRLADGDYSDENGMKFPLGKSGKYVLYNKAGATDEDMLATELNSFLGAITENKAPEISLDDAIKALEVAVEIENIGLSGTAV